MTPIRSVNDGLQFAGQLVAIVAETPYYYAHLLSRRPPDGSLAHTYGYRLPGGEMVALVHRSCVPVKVPRGENRYGLEVSLAMVGNNASACYLLDHQLRQSDMEMRALTDEEAGAVCAEAKAGVVRFCYVVSYGADGRPIAR